VGVFVVLLRITLRGLRWYHYITHHEGMQGLVERAEEMKKSRRAAKRGVSNSCAVPCIAISGHPARFRICLVQGRTGQGCYDSR